MSRAGVGTPGLSDAAAAWSPPRGSVGRVSAGSSVGAGGSVGAEGAGGLVDCGLCGVHGDSSAMT